MSSCLYTTIGMNLKSDYAKWKNLEKQRTYTVWFKDRVEHREAAEEKTTRCMWKHLSLMNIFILILMAVSWVYTHVKIYKNTLYIV